MTTIQNRTIVHLVKKPKSTCARQTTQTWRRWWKDDQGLEKINVEEEEEDEDDDGGGDYVVMGMMAVSLVMTMLGIMWLATN